LRWFGTVRGRLGWLATPQLLLFATGGVIFGEQRLSAVTSFPAPAFFGYPASSSSTRAGGIGGVGAEYLFSKNWSAKIEGLYYDMGSQESTYTCPAGSASCTPGFREGGYFAERGYMIRAGVNWHFNPGPVIAKY
jgi:outer membrane immunogenic protein